MCRSPRNCECSTSSAYVLSRLRRQALAQTKRTLAFHPATHMRPDLHCRYAAESAGTRGTAAPGQASARRGRDQHGTLTSRSAGAAGGRAHAKRLDSRARSARITKHFCGGGEGLFCLSQWHFVPASGAKPACGSGGPSSPGCAGSTSKSLTVAPLV